MSAPVQSLLSPAGFAAANLGFLAVAAVILGWARLRTRPGPAFPGPRPVGPLFKAWLLVIWLVGMLLPLVALALAGGAPMVAVALGWYVAMFLAQIGFELIAWKRWRSPVWVIVPCLFLPWRLFQVAMGLAVVSAPPLAVATLWALLLLWVINVGVHYSNIPNSLRWDHHPADAAFAALAGPNPFAGSAR